MISLLRDIAFVGADGSKSPRFRTRTRLALAIGRMITLCTVLVFTMDALNVDVLYANIIGSVHFQDNPEIVDSQFDMTPVLPVMHAIFSATTTPSPHLATTVHTVSIGTTIIEDVDSPTVLDGLNTDLLVGEILPSHTHAPSLGTSTLLSRDRTISFLRILI